MNTKLYAAVFAVFIFLSQPAFLLGQQTTDKSDWTAVESLVAGDKLSIETKDGKRLKGTMNSVSPSGLNLNVRGASTNIDRNNIRKVYRLDESGSRTKSALLGAAVGAGIGGGGTAIALTSRGGSDGAAGYLAAGIAVGAAIGAALGYFAGKGSKRTLIYEFQ